MATSRSTLLDGLEEISEEEQLMTLLEISKRDVGRDSSRTTQLGPGDGTETQDEEFKKAIEVSRKEKFLTLEEETDLAIIQSLSLAEGGSPLEEVTETTETTEISIQSKIPECPVTRMREIILNH